MIRRRSTLPPVISASGAYYLAHGLMVLAGLISMPIMTRILSKPDYGVLGLLYATISLLAVIGGMGFGEAALRLYSELRDRGGAAARELCNTLLGGSLLAGGIFALIVAGGSLWIGGSRFVQCLPLASALVVIRAASAVFFQIYRAQERAVAHAVTQIFQRYGTMVLAISLLLLYRRDAEMVIIAAIVIEIIAVAARWIDLARQGTISVPALSRPVLAAATAYGLPLALAGSARFLLDYSDRFLIERLLGLDAVAMYSVPNDVTIRLGEALWAPIQLAALPIMFRLWESDGPQATSRFGSDVLSYMIAIMVPIATLFLIHSEEIIVTVASAKYAGAGQLIPYLLPGVLLSSINSIVAVGLTVQKRSATVALTVFGAALFNIALNLILIPRYHLVGAAVATTIAQGALLVANRIAGSNLDLRLHAGPILKAMVATAVPVSLLYALGRVPSTSIITLAVNLGLGTGAAALIFVALEPRVRRLAWLGQDALKAQSGEHGRAPSDRRVLIVARDFPPATNSGTMRTASFVRHLPAFGWKASVVTIRAGHAHTAATATPQLPPDCHVFRAFGFDTKAALAVRGRYPGFLAFPDRDASWIVDGVRQALRAHRRAAADVIWSTSPAVSAHCIAYITKRRTGLPWIADLRDSWNLGTPLGPVARVASRWLERHLLAAADAIVVTTHGMAADLERRCADSVRGKLRVIPNGYEEEGFAAAPTTPSPSSGYSIAHVGECLPPYRDPSGFLRAVRTGIERGDLPPDTRIDFIGVADDPGALRTEVERFNLQDRVCVSGRVSATDAAAAIAAAPLLLLLQTRDLHALCIPTKAYEYLRSGSSILAITPDGSETAALLRPFAGVAVVAPDDIEGIAGALAAAYRAWAGGAERRFVRGVERYDRRRLAGELAQLLDEVRPGLGLRTGRVPSGRSRPTVLHIVDSLQAGGMEVNLAALIAGTLDKYDHRVCCVRASGIVADRLRALDVPVTVIGKRGARDWSMAWRLARHCRQARPHIVHTRNSGTLDGIVGARLARVPVVIHSEHGFDTPTVSWRPRWLLWALSPLVDRILTVSENLRRQLHTDFGVPARKLSVARNGVDAVRFHPRSDRLDLRRRHGYADTDLIIGVAARLGPVKDHVGLVNAFARVAERRPDARLLLVGEGPERGRIEHEVQRLNLAARVRLVGQKVDVEMWLAMLDLFAYAPRFEGMPNGVLEAMATGLPVVVTRVGGVPEAVVDGVTGRLVPLDDLAALAAAIELYCTDPAMRAAHGAAGRARVLAEFKLETMLATYTAAYDGAMAARGVIAIPQSNHRES